jgi:hypothetical protein
MIEDDFYASIKLKTGEEIFCKVSAAEEEYKTMLIISNPVIIAEIQSKYGVSGYKVEPWLKTSTEDIFVIDLENVLTMSESVDQEMIQIYHHYISKVEKTNSNKTKLNRKMGYIANVDDAKKSLEKIYRNS